VVPFRIYRSGSRLHCNGIGAGENRPGYTDMSVLLTRLRDAAKALYPLYSGPVAVFEGEVLK